MNNFRELMMKCGKMVDACKEDDEISDIAEITYNVFSHINQFIEVCGTDWQDYPEEYFYRNKFARKEAITTFSNILNEFEGMYND